MPELLNDRTRPLFRRFKSGSCADSKIFCTMKKILEQFKVILDRDDEFTESDDDLSDSIRVCPSQIISKKYSFRLLVKMRVEKLAGEKTTRYPKKCTGYRVIDGVLTYFEEIQPFKAAYIIKFLADNVQKFLQRTKKIASAGDLKIQIRIENLTLQNFIFFNFFRLAEKFLNDILDDDEENRD